MLRTTTGSQGSSKPKRTACSRLVPQMVGHCHAASLNIGTTSANTSFVRTQNSEKSELYIILELILSHGVRVQAITFVAVRLVNNKAETSHLAAWRQIAGRQSFGLSADMPVTVAEELYKVLASVALQFQGHVSDMDLLQVCGCLQLGLGMRRLLTRE